MLCAGNRTVGSNPTLSATVSEARALARARIATRPSLTVGLLTRQAVSEGGTVHKMKSNLSQGMIVVAMVLGILSIDGVAQRRRATTHASICGNPRIACKTTATFQPNDLPFQVPKNAVIVDTMPFYAIILKSVAVSNDDCKVFIPESERLAAQALFPDHKVFSSRCTDPENLFYGDLNSRNVRNMSENHRIMAVYAGTTLAEAKRNLDAVKATGKFPGANIRRLRTGFNGT